LGKGLGKADKRSQRRHVFSIKQEFKQIWQFVVNLAINTTQVPHLYSVVKCKMEIIPRATKSFLMIEGTVRRMKIKRGRAWAGQQQ
jgi:hypothetical protein